MNAQNSGLTPSRRTLVKGAAWSVPVVAVAGGAPAMAASQEVDFRNLCLACKLPGASCNKQVGVTKGYTLAMEYCGTIRGEVTVDFGLATGTLCGEPRTFTVSDITIEDGTQCQVVYIGLETEPNSANCEISGTVNYTWTSSNGLSGSGTMSFYAATTPPCDYGPSPGCLPNPANANCDEPAQETTQPAAEETTSLKSAEAKPEADVSSEAPASEAPASEAPADVAPTTETGTEGDGTVETTENNG